MTDWTPPAGLARVICEAGAVRSRLGETLQQLGVRKPMIVCGGNVAATPLVAAVRDAAAMMCVLFDGSLEHTPVAAADAGIMAAHAAQPDALIALGGSSTIDCAKAIAVAMRLDLASIRELRPISFTGLARGDAAKPSDHIPLICIPTTLSGAEFFPLFGLRDTEARHKQPYAEQGLVSRTVFLDGQIAASTPTALWVQTGAKVLDDLLLRYCTSSGEESAWDAAHLAAIQGLLDGLDTGEQGDPEVRQANFFHLWLPTCPIPRARPWSYPGWFSVAVRHSLGGMVGTARGAGSCVAMIEALRFHAGTTAARQVQLARLLGGGERSLAEIIAERLDIWKMPRRLADLGVNQSVVGELVASVLAEAPGLGDEAEVRAACVRLW